MTGPKLNEGATVVGERAGTKATAKYVRSSARKARVVLDLIRGLDVRRADEVLQFTDRGIARDVRKVLASAVANAVHNDALDPDELYVLACFADEGPTLRRFRPRARGRATRIRKRSCHITVIVARMSDERLSVVQARFESSGGGRPSSAAASRRARVERSRQRAQQARDGVDAVDADETSDDVESAEGEPVEASEATGDAPYPGSALPLDDGSAPEGFEIKGNDQSMLYHEPEGRYYAATKAEVYFDSPESAEAAGYTKAGAPKADETDDEADEAPAAAEEGASDEAAPDDDSGEADEEGQK
jgi:large subunit ribosomal protein L22